MRISHFFIDRPIFAAVVSIVFVILGGVSFSRLPVAQYPEIAPPIINVAGPISRRQRRRRRLDRGRADRAADQRRREHALHVVELDGRRPLLDRRSRFDLGTNLDIAQVQVQNRVAIAQPRLPADVRNIGVTVTKSLARPDDGRAPLFARQVARPAVHLQLRHARSHRSRSPASTASARSSVFGSRDYSMRVWLDPDRLQSLGLTATDVTSRAAGAEHPGRLRRARPAAGRAPGRLPDRGADARPARQSR